MDVRIETSARLLNWARWERSLPDPRSQLQFHACPMFRDLQTKHSGDDDHYVRKVTDSAHNPDIAEITESQICMMPDRLDVEYLIAYFVYERSKAWIKARTGESERGVGERLAGAIKSYEATYHAVENLLRTG